MCPVYLSWSPAWNSSVKTWVGGDHTPSKHDHLARDAHACCSPACQPHTSEEPMAVQASSWAVQQPGPSGGLCLVKGTTSLQLHPLSLLVWVQQRQEITHFERWSERRVLATPPAIYLTLSNKHITHRKKSEMGFRLLWNWKPNLSSPFLSFACPSMAILSARADC